MSLRSSKTIVLNFSSKLRTKLCCANLFDDRGALLKSNITSCFLLNFLFKLTNAAPILACTTGPMTIFDPIFGFEGEILQFSELNNKMRRVLRSSRRSKIEDWRGSYDLLAPEIVDGGSSTIFEAEGSKIPLLRSSESKIVEPHIYNLRPSKPKI